MNLHQTLPSLHFYIHYQGAFGVIKDEKDIIIQRGRKFGAKVVRGAYLERERFLANKHGYEDPINPTYESTEEMYNHVIDHMIEYICSEDGKDGGHLVVATHNEVS